MLFEGTYNNFRNNTPDWCVAYCTSGGYDYAGLQYGSQCICTNSGPQGTSDAGQCTYGCAGDSSVKMCGGLGYINIFHTDAHKTTIDDWGCGNTVQDTYYQKWYNDMGHCGITPGGSGGSGSVDSGSGGGPKSRLMMIDEGGQVSFISLSPDDHPLPACLNGVKNKINIGTVWHNAKGRRYPALFPSRDGKPLLCGGFKGNLSRSIIRYDGTSDSWTFDQETHCHGEFQAWDFHPEVGIIMGGELENAHPPQVFSYNVTLITDYGKTITKLPDYPIESIMQANGKQVDRYSRWANGCAVIINKTTVFFAGGRTSGLDNNYLKETFYLNLETKEWTRGPDMSLGRHTLTCSLISKPFPQIVIVDGWPTTKLVEILNLATNELTRGPDLPFGVHYHTAVVQNDKVMILGGNRKPWADTGSDGWKNKEIMEYDAQLGNWTILETKVPERPSRGAAMFIDNMDLCT